MSALGTPIPGHPGYVVNEAGEVWSFKRSTPRQLTATRDTYGYLQVTLSHGRKNCRAHRVHKLVALTFLGPRPEGMEIRHLDGDRTNPALANLAYGTSRENHLDMVRHGTHPMAARTHCPAGHPYDGSLSTNAATAGRYCKTCKRAHERARRERAKVA